MPELNQNQFSLKLRSSSPPNSPWESNLVWRKRSTQLALSFYALLVVKQRCIDREENRTRTPKAPTQTPCMPRFPAISRHRHKSLTIMWNDLNILWRYYWSQHLYTQHEKRQFRLERDSNPWPLRNRCRALSTELSSQRSNAANNQCRQRGVGHIVSS